MKLFVIIIAVISFFEIRAMSKKGYYKETAVFISFAVIALAIGLIYYSNIGKQGLTANIFHLLGLEL